MGPDIGGGRRFGWSGGCGGGVAHRCVLTTVVDGVWRTGLVGFFVSFSKHVSDGWGFV